LIFFEKALAVWSFSNMANLDDEIIRDHGAVSQIFELMREQRKTLSIVQNGQRSDALVVKVSPSRLILAKRNRALQFTDGALELQFRCVLGRNIVGTSQILRLNGDFLEIASPAEVMVIQRRQAYRVIPTVDSIAIFLTPTDWILSGLIEDISSSGVLVRLPQTTPVEVPCDIKLLCLHLKHAAPATEFTHKGSEESLLLMIKAATMNIVRKADDGATQFATYGIRFVTTTAEERQLAKMIVSYDRAARLARVGLKNVSRK
jgi:hypothetical protein